MANEGVGHGTFGHEGEGLGFALGGDEGDAVGVGVETGARVGQAVEHDEIEVLAVEFAAGVVEGMVGFEGETHEPLVGALAQAEIGGDVGVGHEAKGEGAGGFALDFAVGRRFGGVVGDGGAEDGAGTIGELT